MLSTTEAPETSVDIALADFFAGCGGTTRGFADAGISPLLAVDWDRDAVETFRLNFPTTPVIEQDIREVGVEEVGDLLQPASESVMLFAGCAPCQPFAGHRRQPPDKDSRSFLLNEFLRFVRALNPELIFVENVPGMQRVSASEGPFADFVEELSKTHHVSYSTVSSADYGVPQTRRRLVLLASRLGPICLPDPTHGPAAGCAHSTVKEWIGSLPSITAGQGESEVSSHRAMRLSKLNLQRIQATPEGGDRRDWPEELWPDCHRDGFKGHTDVYGRLSWDKPAPALTTRCISYSNGRFGHPTQDRALSAREAARLQTFPTSFEFAGCLTSQARQIGNAVPVVLARYFGRHLIDHVAQARRTAGANPKQADPPSADVPGPLTRLSMATVLEASKTSGARHQTEAAIGHGKPVFRLDTLVTSWPWAAAMTTRPDNVTVVAGAEEIIGAPENHLAIVADDALALT